MLNLQDWELVDVYEVLNLHHIKKKEEVHKLLESGIITSDEAKGVIDRSLSLTNKFYYELQKRMEKC